MGRHHSNRATTVFGIWALTFVTAVAGATVARAPAQVVGIAAAILNDVRIGNAAAPQPHRAVLRERVALADQVFTGQRSQLQVMLLDQSVFTVGANARLTIDRFVYDPNGGRSFSASVAKGAFRFMSGRPDRGGGSSIKSPVATIGIRGTIVDGVVGQDAIDIASGENGIGGNVDSDPETATLVILRGPGERTQGGLTVGAVTVMAGSRSVELDQPMLAAYVPHRGASPMGPFTISLSGLGRVQDLIFPALAERRAAAAPTGPQPYMAPALREGRYPRPPFRPGGERGDPSRPSYIPEIPNREPQGRPMGQRPDPRQAPAQAPAPVQAPVQQPGAAGKP